MNSRLDYAALVRAAKRLDTIQTFSKVRLALLSDAATQQFVPLLRTLLHRQGVHAEIYEGAFDGFQIETLSPASGLYAFAPDVVIVLNAVQALRASYAARTGGGREFAEGRLGTIASVWDAIHAHAPKAVILQSTYVMPYERFFGNFDRKVPDSLYAVAAWLNQRIAEEARVRTHVLIHDVEAVASWNGRREWFEDRLWDMAKSFCAFSLLPEVAKNIVDIVLSLRGRVVKCVVLDLDNTLWGGVIGDDGVDGIKLNAHGDGEAFYRLQAYLKELLKRGVLLAVASKNEMENALLPFEKHPDMLLRREDISVFQANWSDKAENIRVIRQTLNIGLDSMLFLDDNPFERSLVRGVLPEVLVPELPEDPADYVRAIAELNLFETTSFSAEDVRRAELYREESVRRSEQGQYADADAFLKSLEMKLVAARFDCFHLPRIAQLMQRSNQFNLTTHRYTEAECEALMHDPGVLPLYAKLSDRLGDHGLIGIVVLAPDGEELVIRDWLMSCRVLARGVERHLMNLVVAEAQARGCTRVCGEYIQTAKNGMVREFFEQFGFTKIGDEPGHTLWILPVSAYEPVATFIATVPETAQ